MALHYLETGSTDPAFNLAFEEFVLENRREGDWLMLWQNANSVIVGLNQNAAEEVDPAYVRAHGIRVVRRMTGGGAVYHDLGNLNYSFITDALDTASLSMEALARPVCRALSALGVAAELSGRNDICVEGRKVSGTAQRLSLGRVLHHGTLLFDTDAEALSGALRADPEKFRSKAARSVRSRVGNIRDFLPASWEWNWGRAPDFGFRSRRRFPGGSIEVRLDIHAGHIRDAAFAGDFMAMTGWDRAREALSGRRFERGDVRAALEGLPLREILTLMFGEDAEDEGL